MHAQSVSLLVQTRERERERERVDGSDEGEKTAEQVGGALLSTEWRENRNTVR